MVLVSLAGCGPSVHTHRLFTGKEVQKAFSQVGLRTHIPFFCPSRYLRCPRAFIASHTVVVVVNDQQVSKEDPEDSIQAWVFSSVRAAKVFTPGPKVPGGQSLRLIRTANVVVQVDPTHERSVKAALAALGASHPTAKLPTASTKARAASLCALGTALRAAVRDPIGLQTTPEGLVALERTEYNDIVANYGSFRNAAKRTLALASGAMKQHLTKVLATDLIIFDTLRAGHWTAQTYRRDEPLIAGLIDTIKPDLRAVVAYFSKCKQQQGA
jgi:hypothetical protein